MFSLRPGGIILEEGTVGVGKPVTARFVLVVLSLR